MSGVLRCGFEIEVSVLFDTTRWKVTVCCKNPYVNRTFTAAGEGETMTLAWDRAWRGANEWMGDYTKQAEAAMQTRRARRSDEEAI